MKPTYKGFEARKSNDFIELPPPGAYVGKIMAVRFLPKDDDKQKRDQIELMIDIIEGEYKDRFVEVWNDRKEKWGDKVPYNGIFRLTPYVDGDEDWRKRFFEESLWCVQESNGKDENGDYLYEWDWHEEKLKGKIVGINLRNKLYTYTNKKGEDVNGHTIEIARLETVDDVREGKCKILKDRDTRKKDESTDSTDGKEFTDVSKTIDVPWG